MQEFACGWCNTRTLILKPFLLQEILNVVIDWLRLYLMIGLGHRNAPDLLLVFVLFYSLLYIEICVRFAAIATMIGEHGAWLTTNAGACLLLLLLLHQIFNFVVLRDRGDLRMSRKTCILFPFYRTWELLFRLHALLRNAIDYAPWRRKNETISYREAEIHDLPPVRACHGAIYPQCLCLCVQPAATAAGASGEEPRLVDRLACQPGRAERQSFPQADHEHRAGAGGGR